jgi:hypothetical protein
MTQPVIERVVVEEMGCHLFTGPLDRKGYGRESFGGRTRLAHRIAYELAFGAIPEGLEIDHLCRVRNCVNPEHLEAVTHLENLRRGVRSKENDWNVGAKNRAKTHCPHGHPYAGSNLKIRYRNGWICRECRACKNEDQRRREARKRVGDADE